MAHGLGRTWGWISQKDVVKILAWSVFSFAVVVLAVHTLFSIFAPMYNTMTTRYPIPYLPANYTLVEKVTNKFVENVAIGGAGGLGAPQVDMSLDMYKGAESSSLHYLTLVHNTENTNTVLHYYDLQPARVVHTASVFMATRAFSNLGGELGAYKGTSGKIDGNDLIVDGKYVASAETTFTLAVVILSFFALWIFGAVRINLFINKLYNRG